MEDRIVNAHIQMAQLIDFVASINRLAAGNTGTGGFEGRHLCSLLDPIEEQLLEIYRTITGKEPYDGQSTFSPLPNSRGRATPTVLDRQAE